MTIDEVKKIEDKFREYYPKPVFGDVFIESLQVKFAPYFTVPTLVGFMERACDRTDNSSATIRYFCGICWNAIRNGYTDVGMVKLAEPNSNHSGKPILRAVN